MRLIVISYCFDVITIFCYNFCHYDCYHHYHYYYHYRKFARFVLFRPIKKRSFNLMCVLDLSSLSSSLFTFHHHLHHHHYYSLPLSLWLHCLLPWPVVGFTTARTLRRQGCQPGSRTSRGLTCKRGLKALLPGKPYR